MGQGFLIWLPNNIINCFTGSLVTERSEIVEPVVKGQDRVLWWFLSVVVIIVLHDKKKLSIVGMSEVVLTWEDN